MKITRIIIKNYRLVKGADIRINPDMNIFVGDNDSGKSTLLEVVAILSSGRLNGFAFDRQLKSNLFNKDLRSDYIASVKNYPDVISPPEIIFEAFCEGADVAQYSGTNNSLTDDCAGIRISAEFNPEYEKVYKQLLERREVFDIPVEFYSVFYRYFNGDPVNYRFCPIRAAFIDTTRKDYSNVVDRFVSDNISSYLSQQEQIDLSTAYRKSRNEFRTNDIVQKLNQSVKDNVHISDRALSIDLKEEDIIGWKRQMSVIVDDTPFENVGFGSQNAIKVELAIRNTAEQVNMVLMEEPENNLSFANMAKLIHRIQLSLGKQLFISTHSSYVANKLDLSKLLLVCNGVVFSFTDLPKETIDYFKKLPGYDTLRMVLAPKVILVEGPTEELIIQRAYMDEYNKPPLADGIDIITVNSLAFKRYCDIALLMKKPVRIITDNDGSVINNINQKYKDYLSKNELSFFYESDEALHTFELSIVAANTTDGNLSNEFRKAISKSDSMLTKSVEEIISFMVDNKVEWASRVFDSTSSIKYPDYLKNAIKKFN